VQATRAATGRLIADATVWKGLTIADGSRHRVFGFCVGGDASRVRFDTSAGRCSQNMLNRSSDTNDTESLFQRLTEDGRRTQQSTERKRLEVTESQDQ